MTPGTGQPLVYSTTPAQQPGPVAPPCFTPGGFHAACTEPACTCPCHPARRGRTGGAVVVVPGWERHGWLRDDGP